MVTPLMSPVGVGASFDGGAYDVRSLIDAGLPSAVAFQDLVADARDTLQQLDDAVVPANLTRKPKTWTHWTPLLRVDGSSAILNGPKVQHALMDRIMVRMAKVLRQEARDVLRVRGRAQVPGSQKTAQATSFYEAQRHAGAFWRAAFFNNHTDDPRSRMSTVVAQTAFAASVGVPSDVVRALHGVETPRAGVAASAGTFVITTDTWHGLFATPAAGKFNEWRHDHILKAVELGAAVCSSVVDLEPRGTHVPQRFMSAAQAQARADMDPEERNAFDAWARVGPDGGQQARPDIRAGTAYYDLKFVGASRRLNQTSPRICRYGMTHSDKRAAQVPKDWRRTVAKMVEDMARFFPGVPSSVEAAKKRMTWPSGDLAIVGLAVNTFGCFSSSWQVLEERVIGAALETLMATHPTWAYEYAKSYATMVWRQHVGVGFAYASGAHIIRTVQELAPATSWVQNVNSGMDTRSPMGLPEDVRRGAAALHLDTADMHAGSRRRDPSASAMALAALDEPQHSESDASDNDNPSDSDNDGDSSEDGA